MTILIASRCWIGLLCSLAVISCEKSNDIKVTSGTYRLETIEKFGEPSRVIAMQHCGQLPYAGIYVLQGEHWNSTDSMFVECDPEKVVEVINRGRWKQSDRSDTIYFYVEDTLIGQHGLVNIGTIRQDSLRIFGSDLDGGDYVYRRK